MSSIDLIGFKGEQPIADPKKLPPGYAVSARNCTLSSGSLEPASGLGPVITTLVTADNGTLVKHPFQKDFRSFGGDVDLIRGPIANDNWERVYWTDGIYPKYSASVNPNSSLKLGLPAPLAAPIVSQFIEVLPAGAVEVDCSYIATYVTSYGEEGPASPPSSIVTRYDSVTVAVSNLPLAVSGEYDIDRIRLYRTEGFGTFNLVTELPIGTITYDDLVLTEALGTDCVSAEWLAPNPSMIGLTEMGNGMLAGFFGNTLCFCEPYMPHAWPLNYQLAFSEDIVSIAMGASGLVVATKSDPWVVSGSSPSSMYQQKIDQPLGCIAKRSMVDMGAYIMYASSDGIVAVAGSEAKLISSATIGALDFQALGPDLWSAFRHDDRYFAIANGFCLSFSPNEGFKYWDIDIESGFYDKHSGNLYCLLSDRTVKEWAAGDNLSLIWKSGIITTAPRTNLTCARVDSEGQVTLNIFMDGILAQTEVVDSKEMFRLIPLRFREIQIEILGDSIIHSVSLAQSPMELS